MKSNEDLLKGFIKSNLERRKQLAIKAGFTTTDQYKEYLVALINGQTTPTVSVDEKPTIHLVDVLDSSMSMQGGKYTNATKGIKQGLREFSKERNVNYTYSLIEFVEKGKIIEHQYLGSLNLDPAFYGARGGDTPLYYTLYNVLSILETLVKKGDKVLIKAYTDGGNNTLYDYREKAKYKIKELAYYVTVTLAGPEKELRAAIRELGLDDSNTLAVENNAEGFEKAFMQSFAATRSYSEKVVNKQNVTTEFYSKKVGRLD